MIWKKYNNIYIHTWYYVVVLLQFGRPDILRYPGSCVNLQLVSTYIYLSFYKLVLYLQILRHIFFNDGRWCTTSSTNKWLNDTNNVLVTCSAFINLRKKCEFAMIKFYQNRTTISYSCHRNDRKIGGKIIWNKL